MIFLLQSAMSHHVGSGPFGGQRHPCLTGLLVEKQRPVWQAAGEVGNRMLQISIYREIPFYLCRVVGRKPEVFDHFPVLKQNNPVANLCNMA